MNKRVLGSIAFVAAASAPAMAADLPARRLAPTMVTAAPSPLSWSGMYVGGHLGTVFGGPSQFNNRSAGFLGGLQAGADYQFAPNWAVGLEGQYSWRGDETHINKLRPYPYTLRFQDTGLASLTGRLGYVWGPALVYVKGGVGFRGNPNPNAYSRATGSQVAYTSHAFTTGYTVGGGVEYMFHTNWSAKLEYQYYDFGKSRVTLRENPVRGMRTKYSDSAQTIKLGLNYRFGWGSL